MTKNDQKYLKDSETLKYSETNINLYSGIYFYFTKFSLFN
jgi:hypothetical protein